MIPAPVTTVPEAVLTTAQANAYVALAVIAWGGIPLLVAIAVGHVLRERDRKHAEELARVRAECAEKHGPNAAGTTPAGPGATADLPGPREPRGTLLDVRL